MYCNNCGGPNPDESSFCNKCGNRLTPQQSIAQQPQATATSARKTNGLAIAALVLGIASFIPPLAICSIPAIILGAIALNQIKKEPAVEGKGMALAGIICGSIALFLWICLIIFWIVVAITSTSTSYDFWVSAVTLSTLI
jgi:uncharacterized membrane protein YvbJ